jgi:methyl-accepting chemotaxis protein
MMNENEGETMNEENNVKVMPEENAEVAKVDAAIDMISENISELSQTAEVVAAQAEILAEAIDELSEEDTQDDEFTRALLAKIEMIEEAMDANSSILDEIEKEVKDLEDEHSYTVAEYIETKTDMLQEKLSLA